MVAPALPRPDPVPTGRAATVPAVGSGLVEVVVLPAAGGAADVVEVRHVHPGDRERVRAFLAGLSLDSAYRRFFTGVGAPSSMFVRHFVEVDPDRRTVLAATAGDHVVGLADTARIDEHTVEVGVVVADRWQRRGLGPRLVAAALEPARAAGCTTLRAHALAGNTRVARMIRLRWPDAEPVSDEDGVVWTVPL